VQVSSWGWGCGAGRGRKVGTDLAHYKSERGIAGGCSRSSFGAFAWSSGGQHLSAQNSAAHPAHPNGDAASLEDHPTSPPIEKPPQNLREKAVTVVVPFPASNCSDHVPWTSSPPSSHSLALGCRSADLGRRLFPSSSRTEQ
jgi:hypothetical protein